MTLADEARAAVDRETEIAELRAALGRAQRAARKREIAVGALVDAVYTACKDAALAHGPAPRIAAPKPDRRAKHREAAVLHLTDWQCGKRTHDFDMGVLRARIHQAAMKAVEITEIQRAHHPVPECHILLGGDMVEGVSIFPGQAFEVEASAFEQVISCAAIIESTVAFALEHFERVTVWEEIGNHGRLGRKGDHPHGDNLDRLTYTIAAQRLLTSQRLSWNRYGGGIGTHVPIGNYTGFLFHGDEIKSFGGNTPAFGILRKMNAWATGVIAPFTDAYGGHFHHNMVLTMANGGRIFMTGSPESGNEYAKEFVAATAIPSQRLNFVHPEVGRVTSEHVLWLS